MTNLVRKLRRNGLANEYDAIIQEQLKEGIVVRTPAVFLNQEFYIPHKAVVKETVESMKIRIVYDASARATLTHHRSKNVCIPDCHSKTSFGTFWSTNEPTQSW